MDAIDRFEDATVDDKDWTDQYDEMLDEVYPEIEFAGMTLIASNTLKELDPTMYRCGFADWIDSLSDDDFGGRYECGKCGERYSDKDEAEECCAEVQP